MKYRPSNDNINVGNFDLVIVAKNIGNGDIYCLLYQPYTPKATYMEIFTKYANTNIGNIPWQFVLMRMRLPYRNLTFNVGYHLHIYSIQWTGDIETIC